jgi:heterogeneous nuclear ribonucleoprotein A1/A3
MSHLTLSSCVLALALIAGVTASHATPLPAQTSHSDLTVLVGRGGGGGGFGGGFGGGRGFGGDGGFARGDGRVIDDAYRGGRYWGGYVGDGGYGYGYCAAPLSDWPRGTCDQF